MTTHRIEPRPVSDTALRLRMVAVTLGLVLLVFAQRAGQVVTDTKINLVVDPARFLGGAMRLWDPVGGSGQLQNQAYGYLFPIGPFFVVGHAIALPAWVVQRFWEATLIVAAFYGVVRLARAFGVRGWWPPVLAGLVYALSPRMLSELMTISSELMPMAALPWAVLPLVQRTDDGSVRRCAGRSAVALALAGGVNAAATLAILPAPLLWILLGRTGRRIGVLGWWLFVVVLASAWWAVPLVLLGRYSPPFLDWIESAQVTTSATTVLGSVRGVDHWESFLGPAVWPSGWVLAVAPGVVLATTAVGVVGLVGVRFAEWRQRRFLTACLLLGLVLITLGHVSTVGPPGAGHVRALLDGGLAAFRNAHKFDPLVRLPVAIGVGHAVSRLRIPRMEWSGMRATTVPAQAWTAAVLVAVGLIAIAPALTDRVAAHGRAEAVPSWWHDAARWVSAHGSGRTLVVPGTATSIYEWGSTIDNPMQALATSPWAVRDAVPLGRPGYVRLLDSIDALLAGGHAAPTLPAVLARAGIGTVVVQNDLDAVASDSVPLAVVRATVSETSGLVPVQQFGPRRDSHDDSDALVDSGVGGRPSALEIYHVQPQTGQVSIAPNAASWLSNGSADDLAALTRAGLPISDPVQFDATGNGLTAADGPLAVTDGIRRREASFGSELRAGPTLTAGEPLSTRRAAADYLPADAGPLSVMRYAGISEARASSSGSDLDASLNRSRRYEPWSALDGDPRTEWRSGSGQVTGEWFEVTLPAPLAEREVSVAFDASDGSLPTQLTVRTDTGVRTETVRPGTEPQQISLPAGRTGSVRVTVTGVAHSTAHSWVGVTSLTLPGVVPQRSLAVPGPSGRGQVDLMTFSVDPGYRSDCVPSGAGAECDPDLGDDGEEAAGLYRTVEVGAATQYQLTATVRLRGGAALDTLLDEGASAIVTASSMGSTDPRARPGVVLDGDPTTSWIASPDDAEPTLHVALGAVRTVSSLRLVLDDPAAALPTEVAIDAGLGKWKIPVRNGVVTLPIPVRTRTLELTALAADRRSSVSSVTFASHRVPVGIGELEINRVPAPRRTLTDTVHLGCDSSLTASVDGRQIPLRVDASRRDVLAGIPVTATPCVASRELLTRGAAQLALPSTSVASAVSLTLRRIGFQPAAASGSTVRVEHWGAADRAVRVDAEHASVFSVRENYNAGWRATVNGARLANVMVDGWQQGWLVPAGTHGTVRLTYVPQAVFRTGLLAGAGGLIAVGMVAALPARRRRTRSARAASTVRAAGRDRVVCSAVITLAGALLGGIVGLVLAVCLIAAVPRLAAEWWIGLVVVAPLAAAAVTVIRGSTLASANSAVVQSLVLLGVLTAATCVVPPARPPVSDASR